MISSTGGWMDRHTNGIGLLQILSFVSVWAATNILWGATQVPICHSIHSICVRCNLRGAPPSCPSFYLFINVTLWVATPSCESACPPKMWLCGMQHLVFHLLFHLNGEQLSLLWRVEWICRLYCMQNIVLNTSHDSDKNGSLSLNKMKIWTAWIHNLTEFIPSTTVSHHYWPSVHNYAVAHMICPWWGGWDGSMLWVAAHKWFISFSC